MFRKILFSFFIIITLGLSIFSIWISYQDKDLYNVKIDSSQISKYPMLPGRMKNLPRNQTTRTTSKSIFNSKHFSTIVLNENSFNSPNKNTEVNGLEYKFLLFFV